MLVALPRHLTEVGLARVLGLGAAHLGFNAADESLLTGVVASETSLLDPFLDLTSSEKLPLLKDLISALLQLLAEWAELLGGGLVSVWVHVLVSHVVLHPVDVEGA